QPKGLPGRHPEGSWKRSSEYRASRRRKEVRLGAGKPTKGPSGATPGRLLETLIGIPRKPAAQGGETRSRQTNQGAFRGDTRKAPGNAHRNTAQAGGARR